MHTTMKSGIGFFPEFDASKHGSPVNYLLDLLVQHGQNRTREQRALMASAKQECSDNVDAVVKVPGVLNDSKWHLNNRRLPCHKRMWQKSCQIHRGGDKLHCIKSIPINFSFKCCMAWRIFTIYKVEFHLSDLPGSSANAFQEGIVESKNFALASFDALHSVTNH